jgi:hypothetical protein
VKAKQNSLNRRTAAAKTNESGVARGEPDRRQTGGRAVALVEEEGFWRQLLNSTFLSDSPRAGSQSSSGLIIRPSRALCVPCCSSLAQFVRRLVFKAAPPSRRCSSNSAVERAPARRLVSVSRLSPYRPAHSHGACVCLTFLAVEQFECSRSLGLVAVITTKGCRVSLFSRPMKS